MFPASWMLLQVFLKSEQTSTNLQSRRCHGRRTQSQLRNIYSKECSALHRCSKSRQELICEEGTKRALRGPHGTLTVNFYPERSNDNLAHILASHAPRNVCRAMQSCASNFSIKSRTIDSRSTTRTRRRIGLSEAGVQSIMPRC